MRVGCTAFDLTGPVDLATCKSDPTSCMIE